MMEYLNIVMLRSFQLLCFVMFFGLVIIQIKLYAENKDSSSIGYRRFNQEERDKYPAVSLCLQSRDGAIFNKNHESLENLGPNAGQIYQEKLLGTKNATLSDYNISYNEVTMGVFNDLIQLYFVMTKQGDLIDTWQPGEEDWEAADYGDDNNTQIDFPFAISNNPFYKSYQDPYLVCITQKDKFVPNQLLNLASFVLNPSAFYKSNIENLLVYLHHPGQLIRQFGKQILHLTRAHFRKALNKTHNYYSIHINQVEVLRKRSDGVVPCNSSLENDDLSWRQSIVRKVGCIPSYWFDLDMETRKKQKNEYDYNLQKCTDSKELQLISQHFLPPKNTDNGTSLYVGPCNQLGMTASVTQSDVEENLILGFNYFVEEYRETVNGRAFDFESLWSQIGGLIGMFLGFGLWQVMH